MANNAIPDSIIMNMICRSLGPPVELNNSNVSSPEFEVALETSKKTLRILNTIKPVTRGFTAMDKKKLVRVTVTPQATKGWPGTLASIASSVATSQVARGDKLEIGLLNEDK